MKDPFTCLSALSTFVSWACARFDLTRMSLIQVPLLPASSIILKTTFSSASPRMALAPASPALHLYRRLPPCSDGALQCSFDRET